MIRNLGEQSVKYFSRLIRITADVTNMVVESGTEDMIPVDVLINDVSIFESSSGQIILASTDGHVTINLDILVKPKDIIKVLADVSEGISYDKLTVNSTLSQII